MAFNNTDFKVLVFGRGEPNSYVWILKVVSPIHTSSYYFRLSTILLITNNNWSGILEISIFHLYIIIISANILAH